jgi:hypothetical protein
LHTLEEGHVHRLGCGVMHMYDSIRIGLVAVNVRSVVSSSLNLHRLDFIKLEVKSSPLVVSCFNNIIDICAGFSFFF